MNFANEQERERAANKVSGALYNVETRVFAPKIMCLRKSVKMTLLFVISLLRTAVYSQCKAYYMIRSN